jgi:hypothetical protein
MKQTKSEYNKQHYLDNKEKQKEYHQNHRNINKDKIKEYGKGYRGKNKDKINEYGKNYWKERYNTDPKFKLIDNLRSRLHEILGGGRSRRTLEVLGCSPEQLTQHLESQFQPWMTWENMGGRSVSTPNTTWDVDHIIPLSSAQTEEDVYRLNHYTNLQPLCSYHNRFIKRDSL